MYLPAALVATRVRELRMPFSPEKVNEKYLTLGEAREQGEAWHSSRAVLSLPIVLPLRTSILCGYRGRYYCARRFVRASRIAPASSDVTMGFMTHASKPYSVPARLCWDSENPL